MKGCDEIPEVTFQPRSKISSLLFYILHLPRGAFLFSGFGEVQFRGEVTSGQLPRCPDDGILTSVLKKVSYVMFNVLGWYCSTYEDSAYRIPT